MKNWFSNCFPLLYIGLHCDEGCIWWHFGGPGTPGFYVGAQHHPEKNEFLFYFFCLFFILKIKRFLSYDIASIFDMSINIKERIDVNQDGPVWLLKPPPPPTPGPQIAKDVNVFHIWKTYYLLFFFVLLMSPVWWGLHDTLIPLDSTYGSPGPSKN